MNEVITIEQAYTRAGVDIKTGMRLEFREEPETPREVSESDFKAWIQEQREKREQQNRALSRREMIV